MHAITIKLCHGTPDGPGFRIIGVSFDTASLDGRHYNRFTVEDNGPGIADDLKGRTFERLQRGSTKAKGSGPGLYLVRSLVESYGGKVRVEDRVTGDNTPGSKFIVDLPVAGDNHD